MPPGSGPPPTEPSVDVGALATALAELDSAMRASLERDPTGGSIFRLVFHMVFHPDRLRGEAGQQVLVQPPSSQQKPPGLPPPVAARTPLPGPTQSPPPPPQKPTGVDLDMAIQQERSREGLASTAPAHHGQPGAGGEHLSSQPRPASPAPPRDDTGITPATPPKTPKYALRSTRAQVLRDALATSPGEGPGPVDTGRADGREPLPEPAATARPGKRPRPSEEARDVARVLKSKARARTRRQTGTPAMPARSE